jgi:hypothetical protein
MALRRRIEKLERSGPISADNLIEQWDRRALACLSFQDQTLVAEVNVKTGKRDRLSSDAHTAAVQRYEEALATTITEVSDEELDRMISSFGLPATLQCPARS